MERYRRLASFAPHLVLLACAGLANPAQARDPQPCSAPLVKALAKQLGQSGWTTPDSDGEGPLVAAACKPWPDDKAQSVVALAYVRPGDEGVAQGERSLALLVAKVDGRSGALLERYDSTLDEDAATEVSGDSLWLDTARYHLAPGVRAFGLVFDSTARGASCPDGGSDEELTLFAPDGKALRPVLKAYLSEWTTIKGTLCVNDPDFMTESAKVTLDLARTSSNGFADLVLAAKVTGDSAAGEKYLRTVRKTLKYDGKQYPHETFPRFWEQPGTPAQ
ncbi:hypothetical protein [Pseudomonas tohonis]|uniref:Multidrug ABC transporter ATPase n=1 Tax=Pseudomonas tohonis TaxID=2725477 RepID=A0ABQ4VYQ1_9PSED|nr:hypothetical protein [Pseudomonas tohonis]GJN52008.1 hypothetical protein TUM20286_17600 [Pseudomonas tohonis]